LATRSGTKNKIQASEAKFYIPGFLKSILNWRLTIFQMKRINQGNAYGHPWLSHKIPSGFIT